jgi:hypothetical protein
MINQPWRGALAAMEASWVIIILIGLLLLAAVVWAAMGERSGRP